MSNNQQPNTNYMSYPYYPSNTSPQHFQYAQNVPQRGLRNLNFLHFAVNQQIQQPSYTQPQQYTTQHQQRPSYPYVQQGSSRYVQQHQLYQHPTIQQHHGQQPVQQQIPTQQPVVQQQHGIQQMPKSPLDEIKMERDMYKQKFLEADAKNNEYERTVRELEKVVDSLTEENTKAKSEIEQLTQKLKETELRETITNEELKQAKETIKQLQELLKANQTPDVFLQAVQGTVQQTNQISDTSDIKCEQLQSVEKTIPFESEQQIVDPKKISQESIDEQKSNKDMFEFDFAQTMPKQKTEDFKSEPLSGTSVPAGIIECRFSANSFVGSVMLWSKNEIPNGWALCDGSNSTPDLREKEIEVGEFKLRYIIKL